jgi:hypothetical protein
MTTRSPDERDHGAPHAPRATALWFGLFGAPAAWTLMFMASYGMAAHFCYPHDTPLSASTFAGLRAVIGGVLLGAIVVATAAALIAIKIWRATNDGPRRTERTREPSEVRVRWMACGGILVSILFLFLILLSGVPVLVVPPCSYGA